MHEPYAETTWSLSFASRDHTVLPLSGYYTQISTLADAQENVMEYLHVLSRPMVINHDHDIIWTEAYMDSRVSVTMAPHGQGGQSSGKEQEVTSWSGEASIHKKTHEG